MTAAVAARHQLIVAAEAAVLADDHLAALQLSEAVTAGAAFIPDDVLFSLSSITVTTCWPAPPYAGWRDLDTACLQALDLHVRTNP